MRDLSELRNKLSSIAKEVANPPPHHRIRVPQSLKDELRSKGARFNSDDGWHYASHMPDEHELADYRVGGGRWVEVANVPFELKDELKEYGMVGEKSESGKWYNYVHASNEDLLSLLQENTVLNIQFEIEE